MKKFAAVLLVGLVSLVGCAALPTAASANTCSDARAQTDWIRNSFTAPGARPGRSCVTQATMDADLSQWYTPEQIAQIGGYYIWPDHDVHVKYGWTTSYSEFAFAHEYGHAADYWIGNQVWPGSNRPISRGMPGLGVEGYAELWSYLVLGTYHPDTSPPPSFSGDQIRAWQALGWLPYGARMMCYNSSCTKYFSQGGIQ